MVLYIAEKKVLGEAIAKALDGKEITKDGVIYKGDSVIVWCSGHLLTLMRAEDYDPKYKEWKMEDLPIYFPNWKNKIPKENEARVKQIGELIKKADIVINCGDTDEEGQLLVDEILRFFHYSGPCKRLDTANTTTDALKKALKNMKDNSVYENDGWSAYAREVSDMIFGINFTRYYSKKYNTLLAVGRVQTPTLGLVVKRDLLIESHKKVFYYILNADVELKNRQIKFRFVPDKNLSELTDGKFLSDAYLKELAKHLKGIEGKYTISKEKVQESAPLPFNLTELNNYCGKKWGYNPDKVMKITQSLRDEFSAITYNRSDCQYLSTEHHKEAPQTISSVCKNLRCAADKFDTSIISKCFNDANITAHFAIIPTTEQVDTSKMSKEQLNVYQIICKYYLVQFLPACIKEKTTIKYPVTYLGRQVGYLNAVSTKVILAGYKTLLNLDVEDDETEDEASFDLSCFADGIYSGIIKDLKIEQKETKPPKRYTQTSLYADMTKISKYVDDHEIKKLLLEKDKGKKGENGSIGTSATRADIIKKLIKVGYLEEIKEGKKEVLISTTKGRKFYQLLPDTIKKADTTALWWIVQEDIKKGTASCTDLIESVLKTVITVINREKGVSIDKNEFANQSNQEEILCKCPNCSSDIVKGKFGPYCKNKCGFRINMVFGKKPTEKQFVSLCNWKKTKITGLKNQKGEKYDAYVVPVKIEEFSYTKEGKNYTGKQFKFQMVKK